MNFTLNLSEYFWNLTRNARTWFAITLFLFLAGLFAGVIFPAQAELLLQRLVDGGLTRSGSGVYDDFIDIFTTNVLTTFKSWCGSPLLGLVPVLKLILLGFALGGSLLESYRDTSLFYFILSTLPHGIIEVPAIFLSHTIFFRFGLRWALQNKGTDRKRIFLSDLQDSIKIGLLCTFLLFLAAIVESIVTPKIIEVFYLKI